ncbi:MAG TPA: lysophospholipid acyltransferase family protein [Myxococcaceae bacterium]|nr:lysophospholipid acyltransferase family protein [Myxococcaceae bacterium]
MLEQLGDELKRRLREWTTSMVGNDLEHRVEQIGHAGNEFGVDPFGFDLDYALAAIAPFLWLYKHYFRVQIFDIDRVPPERVLLVANHSGQLPLDGAMILVAMLTEAGRPRAVRSMVEKWVQTLPYVSTFMARVGQIVGTPENCRRLLEGEEAILVFPEGVRGLGKTWPQRYRLQDFGLGFMRLALETNAPVVPVAVIGAEEQAPSLMNVKPLARMLGFPYLPLTPTIVPLPLPTRYRIYFGEPMKFTGRADEEDAELDKKVAAVKSRLQSMIDAGLKERKHVFS